MSRSRVLVIDDSIVMRKILSEIVGSDPELEVVGTAPTAPIGIQKIPQHAPDIVLLDVEMPDMDGIEAVRRIRASYPKLPVLMCSSLTERGAAITTRAMVSGASDYVAKPSSLGADRGVDAFKEELIGKIKLLLPRRTPPGVIALPPRIRAQQRERAPITALAIGCSTGGPNALATIFASLPVDLPVPLFLVQHMPPQFTRYLAERLTAISRVPAVEASDGDIVTKGQAFIAPGNFHMTVARRGLDVQIRLNQDVPENFCRPSVDVTFRSLARVYGAGLLVAVLTGMGRDGTRGARDVVEGGGAVVVQDEATSVVASMPSSVAAEGLAEGVYPIERVGPELVARVMRDAGGAGRDGGARG